jgi:Carboxypeptidase regulatory-like domain
MKRRTLVLVGLLSTLSVSAEERVKRPEGGPGTVTIPLVEYNRLVDRSANAARPTEPPPLESIVNAAELVLKVAGETVRGRATFEGEVLRRGVTKVLIATQATVTGAQSGGRPVALLQEDGGHVALLAGPAPFLLKVDFAMPVVTEGGRAAFVVPSLHAGTVRLRVEVPGPNADVRLDSGLIVRKTSSGGTTVVEATLISPQAARVSWTVRENTSPSMPHEARWTSDVKTLVTLGEAEVRLAVLADVSVVQGEPRRFDLDRPEGFEIVDISGQTLESVDESAPSKLGLLVRPGSENHHQFLVVLERPSTTSTVTPPLLSLAGAQRETGEVAVEGVGTLELTARESGTLKRFDVRETTPGLRSLAQQPLLAAFRYHGRAAEGPALELQVRRFPAAAVLAALAEKAVVTTLATTQGRTLTEVRLTVRNQAQPFLKVGLPAGAQLLSAEVAGEKVKPVEGKDGARVPLLRAGFKPTGPYEISFVYVQSGAPFGKKGDVQLVLARMDVPVNLVTWEVFLPDAYKVEPHGGNVVPEVEAMAGVNFALATIGVPGGVVGGVVGGFVNTIGAEIQGLPLNGRDFAQLTLLTPGPPAEGEIRGALTDRSGAVIPGATVTVTMTMTGVEKGTRTDSSGQYVLSGVPRGPVALKAESPGMRATERRFNFQGRAAVDLRLDVGAISEEISVEANAGVIQDRKQLEALQTAPSPNVANLQRRVSGVLPVGIDVPRTGTSHRFMRPLVLDEETTLSFRYKMR